MAQRSILWIAYTLLKSVWGTRTADPLERGAEPEGWVMRGVSEGQVAAGVLARRLTGVAAAARASQ